MLKLLKYLKGYIPSSVLAPLFKLVEAVCELIIPLLVAQIIDVGIAGGDVGYIIKMGLFMLLLGALGLLFSLVCQYLAARSSLGYGTNLRAALYRHINTLSYAELDQTGSASLITRITSDVNQTQQAVAMFIRLITRVPFIVIGSTLMALMINPKMALIFLGAAIVISLILVVVMRLTVPSYKKVQAKLDKVADLTRENLSGTRVVRAFSKQSEEQKDFFAAADELSRTTVAVNKISALLNPLTYAIVNFSIVAIIWLGSYTVDAGFLTQGNIIALVNYLSQILLALVVLANLIVIFTKASACASRINEVFSMRASVTDTASFLPAFEENAPLVEFKDVGFSYGSNKDSLKNINLQIAAGSTLGIIGSTGSGKTTLVNLIARFYDCTHGEVLFKGVPVQNIPLSFLHREIGIVAQKTSLFSGTLRENMKWGDENATDGQIIEALKIAQAYDFVEKLPAFLDARVLAGAKNFSGGQRQRLTIARALVKKPSLLILDDSSSALDTVTDLRLRTALKTIPFLTVIIVSQRAGSIKNAEKILVLDDGEAVGLANHAQLMKTCPVYKEICSSQAGGKQ